jgi:hypothetical protein
LSVLTEKLVGCCARMKNLTPFAFVFAAHWLAQFVAWAVADAPGGGKWIWTVLSAPAFPLLPWVADEWFWQVATFNSVVWACAVGTSIYLLRRKRPD